MVHWKFEKILLVSLHFMYEEESPIVYSRVIAHCKKQWRTEGGGVFGGVNPPSPPPPNILQPFPKLSKTPLFGKTFKNF